MKSLIIKYAALITGISIPIAIALYQPDSPEPFFEDRGIVGQDSAEPGELVRLRAYGEGVKWIILPNVPDYQVFGEAGENMVVSFRSPGEYTVVAATLNAGTIQIETLTIKVAGATPPPRPVPTPVDNYNKDIATKVATWSKEVSLPKDLAAEVADKFAIVVAEINNGQINTAEGVVARTSQLMRGLPLAPYVDLLTKLQNLMSDEADAGRLTTMPDHAYLWQSAEQGFRIYSEE